MTKNNWYLRVLLGFGFFVFLIQIAIPVLGDDAYFASQHLSVEWLLFRYQEWSSRLMIEAVLVFMSHHIWLFRVCTSILSVLLLDSLARLTLGRRLETIGYIGVLALGFPRTLFLSAGWVATSLNYLWPISLALFVWVSSRTVIGYRQLLGLCVLFLFATNQEQIALIGFLVFALSSYRSWVMQRERFVSDIVLGGIALIQLIVALLSPGNASRSLQTATAYFPEFLSYSLWDKIQLGLSNTGKVLFFQQHVLCFFLLLLLACFFIWKRQWAGFVIFLPLGALQLNILPPAFARPSYLVQELSATQLVAGTGELAKLFSRDVSLLWNAVFLVFIGCVALALYQVEKNLYLTLIWLLGVGSYMLMGLSPSIFISSDRPAFALYIALVLLILQLFGKIFPLAPDEANVL